MKKYVQVGCGDRGVYSYARPLVNQYADVAQLCGVYDINQKRAAKVSEIVGKEIPVYTDFDEMIKDVQPDTVIVTPKDCAHDEYVIKAMEAGCDVIVEKPLTTTFDKCLAIKEAQERTGKNIAVTFNLRFHPFFKRVKELIAEGVIGDILSVHFEWMLDTRHGADYFRRWHRQRENSGSLMVHKSTHHFDIVNWLLEEDPVEVNAFGTRRFYGPTREQRSERCFTCPYKKKCEFYMNLESNSHYKKLYLDCEDADGYYRDRCVFSEEIDIEDSVSVNVKYSGGAVMSYSLTAHSPYEGINLMLNGTKGRMEIHQQYTGISGYRQDTREYVKIYNRKGEEIVMTIPKDTSEGHGGADDQIRDMLFRGLEADPLNQMAGLRAGMMSIGIGMAANLSMKENRRVALSEFFEGLK